MILLGVQFDRSWKIGFKEWLLAVLLGAKVSFCSVYISFLCSHFDRKQSERKKITATDRLLTETVSHSLLQDQIHLFILRLFFFSFSAMTVFTWTWRVFSLFHCVRVLSLICHYPCSCRELSLMMRVWFFREPALPLSSSLIWHVGTSCQMSRGGRSPNVNVWKVTGTIFVGDLKPPEDITLDLCTLLKFCGELR